MALHEMTHALVFSPGLFDQFHRQPATAFLPAVGACKIAHHSLTASHSGERVVQGTKGGAAMSQAAAALAPS